MIIMEPQTRVFTLYKALYSFRNKANPMPMTVFFRWTGGVPVDLSHLPEGRLPELMEGQLCHHGEGHPLRRHPVLCPRTIQETSRRLLWLSGQVSIFYTVQDVWCKFLKSREQLVWDCKIVNYTSQKSKQIFFSYVNVNHISKWETWVRITEAFTNMNAAHLRPSFMHVL